MMDRLSKLPGGARLVALAAVLGGLVLAFRTGVVKTSHIGPAILAIVGFVGLLVAYRMVVRWLDRARVAKGGEQMQSGITRFFRPSADSNLDANELANQDDMRRKLEEGFTALRRNYQDLISFPLLVIVGESGGGKTELIRRSGIAFAEGMHDPRQGTGGTLGMDWWFADQGVIIDTAGKVVVSESPTDNPQWKQLLQFLRKMRPRCPVNSIIIAIPMRSLLEDDADQIRQKADKLSRNLHLLQNVTGVRCPVSVIVTMSDLLVGYRQFAEHLSGRALQHQILGWSNPRPVDNELDEFDPRTIQSHIGEIADGLERRRLALLQHLATGGAAGGRILDNVDGLYTFPHDFRKLAGPIGEYLNVIFSTKKNQYLKRRPLFMRGLYFASSEQKGAAIDTTLAEALGVPVKSLKLRAEDEGVKVREKSHGIQDLFDQKIFREVRLVTQAPHVKAMLRRRHAALIAAGALAALLVGGGGWWGWYASNRIVEDRAVRFGALVDATAPIVEQFGPAAPGEVPERRPAELLVASTHPPDGTSVAARLAELIGPQRTQGGAPPPAVVAWPPGAPKNDVAEDTWLLWLFSRMPGFHVAVDQRQLQKVWSQVAAAFVVRPAIAAAADELARRPTRALEDERARIALGVVLEANRRERGGGDGLFDRVPSGWVTPRTAGSAASVERPASADPAAAAVKGVANPSPPSSIATTPGLKRGEVERGPNLAALRHVVADAARIAADAAAGITADAVATDVDPLDELTIAVMRSGPGNGNADVPWIAPIGTGTTTGGGTCLVGEERATAIYDGLDQAVRSDALPAQFKAAERLGDGLAELLAKLRGRPRECDPQRGEVRAQVASLLKEQAVAAWFTEQVARFNSSQAPRTLKAVLGEAASLLGDRWRSTLNVALVADTLDPVATVDPAATGAEATPAPPAPAAPTGERNWTRLWTKAKELHGRLGRKAGEVSDDLEALVAVRLVDSTTRGELDRLNDALLAAESRPSVEDPAPKKFGWLKGQFDVIDTWAQAQTRIIDAVHVPPAALPTAAQPPASSAERPLANLVEGLKDCVRRRAAAEKLAAANRYVEAWREWKSEQDIRSAVAAASAKDDRSRSVAGPALANPAPAGGCRWTEFDPFVARDLVDDAEAMAGLPMASMPKAELDRPDNKAIVNVEGLLRTYKSAYARYWEAPDHAILFTFHRACDGPIAEPPQGVAAALRAAFGDAAMPPRTRIVESLQAWCRRANQAGAKVSEADWSRFLDDDPERRRRLDEALAVWGSVASALDGSAAVQTIGRDVCDKALVYLAPTTGAGAIQTEQQRIASGQFDEYVGKLTRAWLDLLVEAMPPKGGPPEERCRQFPLDLTRRADPSRLTPAEVYALAKCPASGGSAVGSDSDPIRLQRLKLRHGRDADEAFVQAMAGASANARACAEALANLRLVSIKVATPGSLGNYWTGRPGGADFKDFVTIAVGGSALSCPSGTLSLPCPGASIVREVAMLRPADDLGVAEMSLLCAQTLSVTVKRGQVGAVAIPTVECGPSGDWQLLRLLLDGSNTDTGSTSVYRVSLPLNCPGIGRPLNPLKLDFELSAPLPKGG